VGAVEKNRDRHPAGTTSTTSPSLCADAQPSDESHMTESPTVNHGMSA
jgi:hypothetical protein